MRRVFVAAVVVDEIFFSAFRLCLAVLITLFVHSDRVIWLRRGVLLLRAEVDWENVRNES